MNSLLFVISRNHFQKTPMRCIMIYKMKRLISTILFLLLTSTFCFCLSDFQFSVAPRVSLSFGELNEILYGYDDTIISQLDWEQKPFLDIGIKSEITFKNFLVSASFDYSFPAGTSYMYDSDWDDGKKYSFTTHPLETAKRINTELTLGYKIETPMKIEVIPEIQFNYIFSDFEAGIGSGIRHERNIRVYGIDYRQHAFLLFTGLNVKAEVSPKVLLEAAFYTAPWNYQESYDHHHGVKHPFSTQEFQQGSFSKHKIEIGSNFQINQFFSLGLFTSILFGTTDKGYFYSDYYTTNMELIKTQKCGSAYHLLKAGSHFTFSL